MVADIQLALTVFAAFFAIMNPISNTAVFIGLTGSEDKVTQKKVASKSLFLTFIVIAVFALFGKLIFELFGITLPALRIAGGILVFFIGYGMLHGESSKMHSGEDDNDTDIAISPLAVPILAGPGTIATAMNYSAVGGLSSIIITVAVFALMCVITYFSFIFGEEMISKIGQNGLKIITRLMGLILAVIGIQMLIEGVYGAIKSFH